MKAPILGIDPGTRKCGFAVVSAPRSAPLELGIVPTTDLAAKVRELAARYALRGIALGGGTHAAFAADQLAGLGLPITVTDERETTLLARRRYFQIHPPKGWRRLIPIGMQLPPRPIDDFAALLIAERMLEREAPV